MSTILVVDDMAVFREPIAMALRQQGIKTVCAANGQAALEALDAEPVDLVLLDVAMPVMDGLTFLRHLRAHPRHNRLPVILLTAVTERDHVVQAGKLGVRDYLLKSRFSLEELFSRVNKHLDTGAGMEVNSSPSTPAATAGVAVPKTSDETVGSVSIGADASRTSAAEALKSIRPVMTRSQVYEQVEKSCELKALSPTVGQLIRMTGSAGCSIDAVAKVVLHDQAIALKVLKLANSVVYSRGEPVESVQKAVMRIGLNQIRQLVLNISVIERFQSTALARRINSQQFWEHSIATGLTAAAISRRLGDDDSQIDTAFTMGLLHDVGRMVFVEQFPQQYEQVLQAADDLGLPVEVVESRMLMVNHADLMDRLLHAWKFSKHLVNPIAMHHTSMSSARSYAGQTVREVAILALANRLAHALLLGSSGNDAIYPVEDFVADLKLRPETLAQIVGEIPDQTRDLRLVMLQSATDAPQQSMRAKAQAMLRSPVRPLFVSIKPMIDAYAFFCQRIAQPDGEEGPNLAVVHLTSQTQRVEVTRLLREAEAKAGVGPLPVVIISPKGNLTLEESAMANRQAQLVSSPTALTRWTAAVNRLLSVDDGADADSKAA